MGSVVEVVADLGQDLWCDISKIITLVGSAKNLHLGLTNHGSQSRVCGAEESTTGLQCCHTIQVRWEGAEQAEGPVGEPHDEGPFKLQDTRNNAL